MEKYSRKKCLIIIPAYNEEKNIEKVVDNLVEEYPEYDYIIINDGSNDNTKKKCIQKGYNILNLPINMGIGGAVQTGYRYALEHEYQAAVQIDGDGQHDVSFLKEMLEKIQNDQADVVIGSRFIEKEGFQSSGARRAGISFLSFLARMLTGVYVKDITSGYRLVNRKFIKIYAEDYPFDYPEPEAVIIAAVYRGRIKEVPVRMKERQGGASSITLKKSVYYMIKVTIAMLIRRLSFGVRRQK